jgi:hypothetical protein
VRWAWGGHDFARPPKIIFANAEGDRGEWHKKYPIPWAAGKDYFMSRLAQDFKIFPYGRSIGAVVSIVMEKDRQASLRNKRKAPLRLVDPRCDVKAPRPSVKGPIMAVVMPPQAVPATAGRCLRRRGLLR